MPSQGSPEHWGETPHIWVIAERHSMAVDFVMGHTHPRYSGPRPRIHHIHGREDAYRMSRGMDPAGVVWVVGPETLQTAEAVIQVRALGWEVRYAENYEPMQDYQMWQYNQADAALTQQAYYEGMERIRETVEQGRQASEADHEREYGGQWQPVDTEDPQVEGGGATEWRIPEIRQIAGDTDLSQSDQGDTEGAEQGGYVVRTHDRGVERLQEVMGIAIFQAAAGGEVVIVARFDQFDDVMERLAERVFELWPEDRDRRQNVLAHIRLQGPDGYEFPERQGAIPGFRPLAREDDRHFSANDERGQPVRNPTTIADGLTIGELLDKIDSEIEEIQARQEEEGPTPPNH